MKCRKEILFRIRELTTEFNWNACLQKSQVRGEWSQLGRRWRLKGRSTPTTMRNTSKANQCEGYWTAKRACWGGNRFKCTSPVIKLDNWWTPNKWTVVSAFAPEWSQNWGSVWRRTKPRCTWMHSNVDRNRAIQLLAAIGTALSQNIYIYRSTQGPLIVSSWSPLSLNDQPFVCAIEQKRANVFID